jgi:hypothetical protein
MDRLPLFFARTTSEAARSRAALRCETGRYGDCVVRALSFAVRLGLVREICEAIVGGPPGWLSDAARRES